MFDKTTLEHWLSAQAGFALLDMALPYQRRDILAWIKRDLNSAKTQSNNARFQVRCDELIAVVNAELAELTQEVMTAA